MFEACSYATSQAVLSLERLNIHVTEICCKLWSHTSEVTFHVHTPRLAAMLGPPFGIFVRKKGRISGPWNTAYWLLQENTDDNVYPEGR